jgi:non-ribosomal peptide synthetase component F
MGELEVQILPREQCSMRHDLRVSVGHNDKGIEMRWDYSADLFKPETIHLMVQRYYSLLEHIVLNPNNRLSDFSLDSLDKGQQTLSGEHSTKGLTGSRRAVEEPCQKRNDNACCRDVTIPPTT